MAWYKYLHTSDVLVVVEDQVSALRLAPHVHAVALLGTHISDAKAEELKAGKYKHIYLSLDADATFTAIKLQLQWVSVLPNLRIVGLGQDIKDMNNEAFEQYLKRIKENN